MIYHVNVFLVIFMILLLFSINMLVSSILLQAVKEKEVCYKSEICMEKKKNEI